MKKGKKVAQSSLFALLHLSFFQPLPHDENEEKRVKVRWREAEKKRTAERQGGRGVKNRVSRVACAIIITARLVFLLLRPR